MVKHAENRYRNFMRNNPELSPWGTDDDDEDEDRSRSPPGLVMGPAISTTQELTSCRQPACLRGKFASSLRNRDKEATNANWGASAGHLQDWHHARVLYKRFQLHKEKGWDRMVVMYQSDELGAIEMLEAALISQHCHLKQCRNVLRGGEGMRENMFQPKFEPPYFCYCVSARADRPRWVV